jgi:hypothetical protein
VFEHSIMFVNVVEYCFILFFSEFIDVFLRTKEETMFTLLFHYLQFHKFKCLTCQHAFIDKMRQNILRHLEKFAL